tara:strand:+ start:1259 stop:2329 length:1071 start_codon:yes stop_codon:yes gene_type:complete
MCHIDVQVQTSDVTREMPMQFVTLKYYRKQITALFLYIVLAASTTVYSTVLQAQVFGESNADFIPPDALTRKRAIGDLSKIPAIHRHWFFEDSSFKPIARPEPGDWLATQQEKGQTYQQYLKSSPNRPNRVRNTIYLLPLSTEQRIDPDLVLKLTQAVRAFYGINTKVLDALPLQSLEPTERTNPLTGRQQVLTTDILKLLTTKLPSDAYCVLAITMADLYPGEQWNFVFGHASFRERVGVYSFARYQPDFPGTGDPAKTRNRLLRRCVQTLLHETAHMFGLHHCIYYECLVNGSNHMQESDSQPLHFCPVCLRKIHNVLPDYPIPRYRRIETTFKTIGLDDDVQWFTDRLKKGQQ